MKSTLILACCLVMSSASIGHASQPPGENDEFPSDDAYEYGQFDPATFVDDPGAPDPDPQFTVRSNVPRVTTRHSNGTVTVRFTGRVRVTVRPRFPVPNRTPRTSRVPAGWEQTGPDENNNGLPDELDSDWVDVAND